MKILHVGKFWPGKGGMERMMYDIVQGFSSKGYRCDLLCAAADGASDVYTLNDNGKIMCTPTWFTVAATKITPAMIWKLRRICNEYDILHIHHPDPMANLALLTSGFKGKVVLHWHSDILKQKNLLKIYKPLQDWMIRRADLVVGTSPVYLKESPHLTEASGKMACLPIGVQQVEPDKDRVKAIRDKYPGKKLVFTVGRLVGYKGHKYLIDSAKYLPEDYVILIGGGGPLSAEMQKQIDEEGLSGKVVLLGRLSDEDLADHYGACDLFCLSSIWKTEAFGMVQIEAMSCGKPVVATKIPGSGVAWVNKHGYSGLNVPPEDSAAIAEAIRCVLADEQTYQTFSVNAKARYEEHFTMPLFLDRCGEIYERVLNGTAADYGL